MPRKDSSQSKIKRYLLIIVCVLVLLGLMGHAMRTLNGIEGKVIYPSCTTQPCSQARNPDAFDIVVTKDGREITRVRPGQDDHYRINLSAGRYQVRIDDAGPDSDYPSYTVQVERGKVVRQDLSFEE